MQSNNPGKLIIHNTEGGGLAVEKNLAVTNYYDQCRVWQDTITGLVLQAKCSTSQRSSVSHITYQQDP